MSREPHSRELFGHERSVVVADHLASLEAPQFEDVRDGDSPIAIWARGHRLGLAQRRSRLNWRQSHNRKRDDRPDDYPRLKDEVS